MEIFPVLIYTATVNLRPYRLVVRTGGSHPPNRGSIPLRAANNEGQFRLGGTDY